MKSALIYGTCTGKTEAVADKILAALRGGRPVQPLSSSQNRNHALQPAAWDALKLFLGVDSWAGASDQELSDLQEKIMCM